MSSLSGVVAPAPVLRPSLLGWTMLSRVDFPTPLWPVKTVVLPLREPPEGFHRARPVCAPGRMQRVSDSAVLTEDRLRGNGIDQVRLVDADDPLNSSGLAADEEAIDQRRLERRIGGGGDNNRLIDIGGDDQVRVPSLPAGESRAAGFDPLDDPGGPRSPAGPGRDPGRHRIPRIAGQIADPAAESAIEDAAFGPDRTVVRPDCPQDAAANTDGFVDNEPPLVVGDDRPLPPSGPPCRRPARPDVRSARSSTSCRVRSVRRGR